MRFVWSSVWDELEWSSRVGVGVCGASGSSQGVRRSQVVLELGRDPLSGDLYLFVSRNRIRAKVLHWDGTGLCVYAKCLEKGRFASLWSDVEGEPVRLTTSE